MKKPNLMTIPDNEMNGIKDTITIKILFFPTQFLKRCANTLVLHQLSNGQCSTGWRYSTQLTTGLPAGTCQAWISTSIKPISLQAIQTVTSNEKLKEHFLGRKKYQHGKKRPVAYEEKLLQNAVWDTPLSHRLFQQMQYKLSCYSQSYRGN